MFHACACLELICHLFLCGSRLLMDGCNNSTLHVCMQTWFLSRMACCSHGWMSRALLKTHRWVAQTQMKWKREGQFVVLVAVRLACLTDQMRSSHTSPVTLSCLCTQQHDAATQSDVVSVRLRASACSVMHWLCGGDHSSSGDLECCHCMPIVLRHP